MRPGTKKQWILAAAKQLGLEQFTPQELERLRRLLIAEHGASGKASLDYIAQVLNQAGIAPARPTGLSPTQEAEFRHLLRFATLEDAELCLVRLDELVQRARRNQDRAAEARLLEIARLGRRRALMIARNARVEPTKREEKAEIARWFQLWLQTPDAFFDWLELRKNSPEFRNKFLRGNRPHD